MREHPQMFQVPLEDLRCAARSLVEALRLRSEYMELIGATFPTTTRNFLTGKYPRELPKYRRKNTESCEFGVLPPFALFFWCPFGSPVRAMITQSQSGVPTFGRSTL